MQGEATVGWGAHMRVSGANLLLHGCQALLQAQQLVLAPLRHCLVLACRLCLRLRQTDAGVRQCPMSAALLGTSMQASSMRRFATGACAVSRSTCLYSCILKPLWCSNAVQSLA